MSVAQLTNEAVFAREVLTRILNPDAGTFVTHEAMEWLLRQCKQTVADGDEKTYEAKP